MREYIIIPYRVSSVWITSGGLEVLFLVQVVTLTKNPEEPDFEEHQLHVLPFYRINDSDEHGDHASQDRKSRTGAIEALSRYVSVARSAVVPGKPSKNRN